MFSHGMTECTTMSTSRDGDPTGCVHPLMCTDNICFLKLFHISSGIATIPQLYLRFCPLSKLENVMEPSVHMWSSPESPTERVCRESSIVRGQSLFW